MNEVVNRLLFIALILTYAAGFCDLKTFITLFVSIHLIQLVALFGYLLKVDVPSIKVSQAIFNRKTLAPMISYGLLLLFAGTASMGIKLLDTIVLGQFVSLDLVGVYAVVAFIPTFIEAPLNALDKIASPKIASALVNNDTKQILEIYTKSSRYLFAFGALMVLLLVFNIDALLTFLPERFAVGRNVILILSISALFNLITGSNNAIVFNSEKFYIGSAVLVLISLITLALLYAFIPKWGLEGAAIAIGVSSILYNTFKYLFILIKFGIQPFDFKTALILMNFLITAALSYFIHLAMHPLLSIVVHGLLITAIYGTLTVYTRVVSDLNWKKILG
jgi:O-antigen/teichoic acid export membrane protein